MRKLYTNAPSVLRLYMLLALNCAMGQRDIAELKCSEVDWENSHIDRERWKTKVRARYKLWPLTLQLLREHRCSDPTGEGRVLLNDDGLPLARHRIEDGKYKKCDSIKTRFDRLLRATGLNSKRSFYCLRKTGATLIEAIDPAATSMYLSHSEKEMKRAYAQRDWERLGKALEEMEKRLSFVLKSGDAPEGSNDA